MNEYEYSYKVSSPGLSVRAKPLQLCSTCGPVRLLCPWDSPGKDTGVGCYSLLQGIFLTQGLNPGLLRCRQILYHLSHWGTHIPTYDSLIYELGIFQRLVTVMDNKMEWL